MALGAETGTATINVSENLASSSLLDVEARSVEALRETGYTGTEEIVVRTLDEVVEPDWRRPLALKIDTQGFELEVLKGAQQTLADISSEEHTSELQSLMRQSYAVFCLQKKTTRKRK